jgi:hypothetical protein
VDLHRPPAACLALALVLAAHALGGCAGASSLSPRPAPAAPPAAAVAAQEPPAAVLARFVDALEAGRWTQAGGLLSARWRAAYTPARLQADYAGAGPLAREATARVQAAIKGGARLRVEDGRAWLPTAGGKALLVSEEGGWKVDALE